MQEDFEAITQYDKSFDSLFTNINHKGFACGFFSILTVAQFMNMNTVEKHRHEEKIKKCIEYTVKKKINYGLTFNELIKNHTNYINEKDICATSVELIKNNILSYEHIFENKDNKPYGIIFLKNEKFFVVLYDTEYYYIRDCHVSLQKTIKTFNELKIYLKNTYQFEENIDLLGDEYLNYSSIEYMKFYEDISTPLNYVKSENSWWKNFEKKEEKYEMPSRAVNLGKKLIKEVNMIIGSPGDYGYMKVTQKQEDDKITEKTEKLFTESQNLDFNQYEKQEKIYTNDDTVCF